jgi:hypothetical protein
VHFFQEVATTMFALRALPPAAAQGPGGTGKAQTTPKVSGMLIGVDVWNHPVEKGGTANASVKQGTVDVYDHFIVLNALDGTQSVYPHGWYTNLRFRTN